MLKQGNIRRPSGCSPVEHLVFGSHNQYLCIGNGAPQLSSLEKKKNGAPRGMGAGDANSSSL